MQPLCDKWEELFTYAVWRIVFRTKRRQGEMGCYYSLKNNIHFLFSKSSWVSKFKLEKIIQWNKFSK